MLDTLAGRALEYLENAADNGYDLSGWTDAQVAEAESMGRGIMAAVNCLIQRGDG